MFIIIQMIKQSKINSFLGLISKAHSQQKRQKMISPFRKSKVLTEESCNKTIFDSEVSFIYHNHHELEGIGLEYTQSNFKETFRERLKGILGKLKQQKDEDKRNVYDAYRQSLEKKHSYYTNTRNSNILGYDKQYVLQKHRLSMKNANQINFPISRPNKKFICQHNNLKQQKRRQLTSQSQINSSKHDSPKRTKTQGLIQAGIQKNNIKKVLEREEFQQFRPQPITQEPMFRIQKCPAFCYQDELYKKLSHKKQEYKQQKPIDRKCELPPRLSWKDTDNYLKLSDKKMSASSSVAKKSQRYIKKLEKFANLEKVAPWQYQQKDAPELFEDV